MAFDPLEGILHTAHEETCNGEARLAAWTALTSGAYCVLVEERVYLFVTPERPSRPLTQAELVVVDAAARALRGKEIAYTLGIAPSTVSATLSSAASKLGLSSTDLARLARALVVGPSTANEPSLSDAERKVLALLLEGKSNAEIAHARNRSIRTIANQVASILRKTDSASRHVLRVKS